MLSVRNLCKKYPAFELKNVSFDLPEGYIMGFIGANGAGKTTTIKSMLNLVTPDSGTVTIFGKDIYRHEVEIKQDISVMIGGADFYSRTSLKRISKTYSRFYTNWNQHVFNEYLKRFELDENKKIIELSSGMRIKFGITLALSHDSKLIIFDEPTSGLDPVAREELLELFRDIVDDGRRSILFSTHITSDLDICADYIIFIKNGELIANDTKDNIIAAHKIVKGSPEALTENLKGRLIGYRKHNFGFTGLIRTDELKNDDTPDTEIPNLEEIMVFYSKEKRA